MDTEAYKADLARAMASILAEGAARDEARVQALRSQWGGCAVRTGSHRSTAPDVAVTVVDDDGFDLEISIPRSVADTASVARLASAIGDVCVRHGMGHDDVLTTPRGDGLSMRTRVRASPRLASSP